MGESLRECGRQGSGGNFCHCLTGHRGAGEPYPIRTVTPWSLTPHVVRSEGHGSRGGRDPWPRPRGHDCPEVSEGKQAPLVRSRSQGLARSWGDRAEELPWPAPPGSRTRTTDRKCIAGDSHAASCQPHGLGRVKNRQGKSPDSGHGPEGDRRSHRPGQPNQGVDPQRARALDPTRPHVWHRDGRSPLDPIHPAHPTP